MPADNAKWPVHFWQGLYGGLGHLYSPNNTKGPYPHLPYALDNGAFPAWTKGLPFDTAAWLGMIQWATEQSIQPQWVLVPDVVTNKTKTIESWHHYVPILRAYYDSDMPLAFAVQDGMEPRDVPKGAGVVFIGGSTDFKWRTLETWCRYFPRVHVGRVNSLKGLVACSNAGAESCDGTGWFRGDKTQLAGLQSFLRSQAGTHPTADFIMPKTKRKCS